MGGRVVARRWRCRGGELDLVVALGDMLVFAEVKTRRTLAEAAFATSPAQMRRIERTAERYALDTGVDPATTLRFDIVLVAHSGETELIENVTLN
jgi:putative endonuclease